MRPARIGGIFPAFGPWDAGSQRNVPLIVAASAGLMLLVAGTLGWLGWRLLSQEETLLRQRSQDRLEQAADALLAGFLRTVADTESWLGQISSALPADADGPARRGGMLVMFSGRGVHTQPSGVLPYLPVSPPSVAIDSAVFQPSELLEFQLRDLNGAATLLTQLASRGNSLVRAEALLRLARVQAKAGHIEQALATYTRLRDETLIGPAEAPYSLLSRFARVQLLADSHRDGRGSHGSARTPGGSAVGPLSRRQGNLRMVRVRRAERCPVNLHTRRRAPGWLWPTSSMRSGASGRSSNGVAHGR